MKRELKVGGRYLHFKYWTDPAAPKELYTYKVLSIVQDTESEGKRVIYQNLMTKEVYDRPYDMFMSEVDKDKYPNSTQKYRFEEIILSYTDYLALHKRYVADTWTSIFKPVLKSEGRQSIIPIIDLNIKHHDGDKTLFAEYPRQFKGEISKDSPEYKKEWLRHQNSNPHHWQYWILLQDIDSPKLEALEMPLGSVIEMICDWQAASLYNGFTANDWYKSQKDNMILHPKTRKLVEKYLKILKKYDM